MATPAPTRQVERCGKVDCHWLGPEFPFEIGLDGTIVTPNMADDRVALDSL